MPAPASVDEFLGLIHKSGVAEESRTKPYVQKLRDGEGIPADPGKFAGLMVRDGLLTFFQAEQLLQGKWKRFTIGKYKVLEKIGVGGMGQVFLCEHKLMRRRVAVKVLPTAKAADSSSLDRFYREARAAAALDHPNIVRAYDIDQDENLHFLVMEFVDGTNLQDLVKKSGPLDVTRACHYIFGAAVGLQYACDQGIVHRDIKPGNILVDRTGVVKILDMGLARFFNADEDDQLTRKYDENVLGTADYLAPEQAVDSHTADIRADIYSLGGTFYYLLTGQPPFPEGSVAQKLLWHQTREAKPVRDLRPEVPVELVAVLSKMMAKELPQRFATPSELLAALGPWVQSPIPPPAESELPHLSAAALGIGAGGLASRATSGVLIGGPSTGLGGTRSHPALPIASTPDPMPTPAAIAAAAASDDPPPGVWNDLAMETRAGTDADTGPTVRPKPERRSYRAAPATAPAPPRRSRRKFITTAVAVVAAFGGAAAAYFAFSGPGGGKATVAPGSEGRRWYVAKAGGPDPERSVPTLLAAIQKAGPGDTITILDDPLTDAPIRLDGEKFRARNLTIEAGTPGKVVTWTPPPVASVDFVFGAVSVEGLTVRGLILDAGAYKFGVSLGGFMPGATLEDVTVRGAKEAGVRLNSVSGDAGRPVKLTRVRASGGDAGLLVRGDARVVTKHVVVAGCRFDGPGKAGVRIDGPAVGFEVRQSRFFGLDAGVVFAGMPAAGTPAAVRVVENTFHSMKEAAVRADVPVGELVFEANFVAAGGAVVAAKDPAGVVVRAAGNARDEAAKEGNVPAQAAEVKGVKLPTDAADDATFLRPAKDGPLSAVGPGKKAAGAIAD